MNNKLYIGMFLCMLLSISFVQSAELTRLSHAEQLRQLEHQLEKELKEHPEHKEAIVRREFEQLYNNRLRHTIQQIYAHNITTKLHYDSEHLTLSRVIVLLYDRQFHNLIRNLTHVINHEVWDHVHHQLKHEVQQYLRHQYTHVFNSSNSHFVKELLRESSQRAKQTIAHVSELVHNHTDHNVFRHNVVANVTRHVIQLLEDYASGKVHEVNHELQGELRHENQTVQQEEHRDQQAEAKQLQQHSFVQLDKQQGHHHQSEEDHNVIPENQIIHLAEKIFYEELRLHEIHERLRVHVPVFSLIKLGVQFIASKHLSTRQQQNISHGLELLNRQHLEQVFQTIRNNSRIQNFEQKAVARLGDLKFTNAKQLIEELDAVVKGVESDSVFNIKVLDKINDISDDDVSSLDINKKLQVPQSLQQVNEHLIQEVTDQEIAEQFQNNNHHHHHHHHHELDQSQQNVKITIGRKNLLKQKFQQQY